MPIYEYACENCGKHIEVFQSISAEALVNCEACHQATLKKLISASGFRLKGSGWYETDFKTADKQKNLAVSDEKAPEKKADTAEDKPKDRGKTEGKTETASGSNKTETPTANKTSSTSEKKESSTGGTKDA